MTGDAADAVRYVFVDPQHRCGPPEAFVPRSANDPARRARILERVSAWYGAPVEPGGVRVTITANVQPLLTALRQVKWDMLARAWAARDYPLRGAHKALSRPKPLRAGLAGRHARRGTRGRKP